VVESLPDALEGSFAPKTVGGVDGSGDATDDGPLEERPQGPGGEAEASDLVGEPDTEGASTALPPMTVTAKEATCSKCLSLWRAVVKSEKSTMPDERSNRLAVGAGGLFEPLDNRDPLLFASIEPSLPLVAHVDPMLPGKSLTLPAANWMGGAAGSDEYHWNEEAGSPIENKPQNRNPEITEITVQIPSPLPMPIRLHSPQNAIRVRESTVDSQKTANSAHFNEPRQTIKTTLT
jgi:hypothetical protein